MQCGSIVVDRAFRLLKRRQIRQSRPCALATAELLLRVVAASKTRDHEALLTRIRQVGQRLVAAQPRELAVGNIVRRVLGVIREVVETDTGALSGAQSPTSRAVSPVRSKEDPDNHAMLRQRLKASASYTSMSPSGSLLGILRNPGDAATPTQTPPAGTQSPVTTSRPNIPSQVDMKAEVIDGIKEILGELETVDADIAQAALDHIHSDEVVLTHTSSQTVQRFLQAAARKRKFTVVHVESYPNDHFDTHNVVLRGKRRDENGSTELNSRWKTLTSMGITVIVIPDSAVFALMSRVNKVILAPHAVLANGGLIAASGAMVIAQAAKAHKTPVVVVSGVYKLSPMHHFDTDKLTEYGDPGKVIGFDQGDLAQNITVLNPLFDHVPAELVDLYITNL